MRRATYTVKDENHFYHTLRQRVKAYQRKAHISGKANGFMIAKMCLLLMLFLALYVLLISNIFPPFYMLGLAILFGMVSAFIGCNIAHDAMHGALFRSARLNRIFGYTFDMVGMSSYAWHLKHNVVHHLHPNVRQVDFDIEAGPILRLSPADRLRPHHRYQHLYAPLTYMLFSLSLVFFDDFVVVFGTRRETIDGKPHPIPEKTGLLIAKVIYLFFMLVLPMLALDIAWWQVLAGFVLMHATLSIFLAFVLIPAHLFEHTTYPKKDAQHQVHSHWAVHQMATTIDYSRKSRICNLLFGGLNTNVVHHLFPRICHVYLIPISQIVKETADEFGIPYHETTLWGAMVSHLKALKKLGREDAFLTPDIKSNI